MIRRIRVSVQVTLALVLSANTAIQLQTQCAVLCAQCLERLQYAIADRAAAREQGLPEGEVVSTSTARTSRAMSHFGAGTFLAAVLIIKTSPTVTWTPDVAPASFCLSQCQSNLKRLA